MPPSEGSTGTSQSLERGLAILSSFHSDRPLIGVSELSRELDLSRSTAHRYIATLAQLGYLQQDPDSKRYRLGPKVLDLGFSAINSMDLREISAPHLRAAQRRDAATRSTWRSSTAPTSSTSSAAARPGPASGRSTSTSTSARDCRPIARRYEGDALTSPPSLASRRSSSASTSRHAGPNTLTDAEAFREELAQDPRGGHRRERRGTRPTGSGPSPPRSTRSRARCSLRVNLAVHRTMVSMDELLARFGPAVVRSAKRHLSQHGAQDKRLKSASMTGLVDAAGGCTGDDRDRALPRLARARARARVCGLRRTRRWSVYDLAGVLGLDLGVLRGEGARPVHDRAGVRRDARGGLVPGRAPQLRRAPDRHTMTTLTR